MLEQDPELLQELLEIFSIEARETLEQMTRDVLAIERTADEAERSRLLEDIFRHAHTLKGSADAVNLTTLKSVAHQLETLFEKMRGGVNPDQETIDLILQAIDAMGDLVEEANTDPSSSTDTRDLLRKLASLNDSPGTSVHVTDSRAEDSGPRDATSRDIDNTFRVAATKLDSVISRVGELIVASSGAAQHIKDLRALDLDLAEWESSWREVRLGRKQAPAQANGDGQYTKAFLMEGEERIKRTRRDLDRLTRSLGEGNRTISRALGDLEEEVRGTRMLPILSALEGLARSVRDLSRVEGKKVSLEVHGGETQLDRVVLEKIKAPLSHLVRNAIAHGIEKSDVREAIGKPEGGVVKVTATQRGSMAVIEVEDDGAGVDETALLAAAIEKGLVDSGEARALQGRTVLELLFRPGFSLSPMVTDLSGRGVGLDVVRANVEDLNGTVEVNTSPGKGTRFTIILPLTITTTHCVLVRMGEQIFALPMGSVVRSVRLVPSEIRTTEGREAARIDGEPVGVSRLFQLLGISAPPSNTHLQALVIRSAERTTALIVEQIVGIEEIIVKPLPGPLAGVSAFAGAAILGTGRVVAVLNPANIISAADALPSAPILRDEDAETERSVVMIVDDSITTRTLEKNIFEAAGYVVKVAVDGVDAWTQLQSDKVDLVVSDVTMPRLNGFELTAKIRSDQRFQSTPVVLVTSLDSPSDRERGIEVGADAYVVKSTFDQEHLLSIARRLI